MSNPTEATQAIDLQAVVNAGVRSADPAAKVCGEGIATASLLSGQAANAQKVARDAVVTLLHAIGEILIPQLEADDLTPEEEIRLVNGVTQGSYTSATDFAREAGKDHHKAELKAGRTPSMSQTEAGKRAKKGLSQRRRDFENFSEAIIDPNTRAAAIAMANPPTGADGEATFKDRAAEWQTSKRARIVESEMLVNIGTTAPWNNSAPIYRITTALSELNGKRTDGKHEYATLTMGSGKHQETFEVRLGTMEAGTLLKRLDGDIEKDGKYLARAKASRRSILDDFTPPGLIVTHQQT